MKKEAIEVKKTRLTGRRWFVRLLEIIPGAITWTFLLAPIVLSLFTPVLVAYFIIAFDLFWLVKSMRLSSYLVRGYRRLYQDKKIDWQERLNQLSNLDKSVVTAEQDLYSFDKRYPVAWRRWQFSPAGQRRHRQYVQLVRELGRLRQLQSRQANILDPRDIYNVVIMSTSNESRELLNSSMEALVQGPYSLKKVMFVLAYEERGGASTESSALDMIKQYGSRFAYAVAIKHPDGIVGELKGKGANITHAARQVTEYILAQGIDPEHVIVTVLDADHRPSLEYFAYLTYIYVTNSNRTHRSYQPIPMFYNNIWDAPAPMRVIATGSSFWMIMEGMRPNRLRNFAAHAQSLRTLLDTDYWSVTSAVEDGHQYWRTYFTYDGDHKVVPLFTPIYQDAVLAHGYLRTFQAQYLQLRRWAWGVSDFPYVVTHAIDNPRIPLSDRIVQIGRLFEGHFSWATAPLILSFVAWLPLFLNPSFASYTLAHELPIITSRILTLATIGLLTTIFISLISLPPKPPRYRTTRVVAMLLQWILLPVVTIIFSALPAIDAQTRLMFGRRLGFYVTEKARKSP